VGRKSATIGLKGLRFVIQSHSPSTRTPNHASTHRPPHPTQHPQDPSLGDDALRRLGQLMDASHASCAQLYQCSCPELDALVKVAKGAGAIGSRLTGGWVRGWVGVRCGR